MGSDISIPKIPAKAGIHLLLLPHAQEETSGDGPLPAQGPAGGKAYLSPTNTASPADAEVSCRNYAEPAARDSGVRRRDGERGKWVPDICLRKFRNDRRGQAASASDLAAAS